MKRKVLFLFLTISSIQASFAQKIDPVFLKKQASTAFESGEFEKSVTFINKMQSLFRQVPIPYLSMRIRALNFIVSENPLHDYQRIAATRGFIVDYLENPSSKADPSYNSIIEIDRSFNLYPKDEKLFLMLAEKKSKEDDIRRDQEITKARELELVRKRNDSIELINYTEIARIGELERVKQARKDSIVAVSELNEKQKNDAKAEKKAKKALRILNFNTRRFSNFGFQSGEVAQYGLLYEYGGKKILGFHLSARSSLTPPAEVLTGKSIVNKTEIDIGPSFKLANWLFLNLGAGYGFYNYVYRNDYLGESGSLEMQPYLETSGGLMIRLGRIVNLSAGVSFMDIDKELYRPEITGGLTFNLKKSK